MITCQDHNGCHIYCVFSKLKINNSKDSRKTIYALVLNRRNNRLMILICAGECWYWSGQEFLRREYQLSKFFPRSLIKANSPVHRLGMFFSGKFRFVSVGINLAIDHLYHCRFFNYILMSDINCQKLTLISSQRERADFWNYLGCTS